jgi:hypothetical protein
LRLLAQHPQGVGQRRHAVPAQLHVVVEAAPDRVRVRIIEAGDGRAPAHINHGGAIPPMT